MNFCLQHIISKANRFEKVKVKVKGICLCWQSFNHFADTVSTEKETAHRFAEVMIENYWYWQSFDLNTIFLRAPPVKTPSPLVLLPNFSWKT